MNNTTNEVPRIFAEVPRIFAAANEIDDATELVAAARAVEAQAARCRYAETVARCALYAFKRQLESSGQNAEAFAAAMTEYERSKEAAAVERHNLAVAEARLEIERQARLTARLSAAAERAEYAHGRERTARCERDVALVRDRVRRSCWTLASAPPPSQIAVVVPLALRATHDHDAPSPRRPHATVGVSATCLPTQYASEPSQLNSSLSVSVAARSGGACE